MNCFRIPFALLAGLSLVFACVAPDQPEEQKVPNIEVPSESQSAFSSGIDFGTSSGSQTQSYSLSFTATDDWYASVVQTKAPAWVSVRPSSGSAGTVHMEIIVQPNSEEADREAVITIVCGSVEKSITVRQAGAVPLVVEVSSLSLDKTSLTLEKGESVTLTATVKPDNATDKTVGWSSSDTNVVTVDQNGKITALKGGSAVITAQAGGKSAECQVTVTVPVESVSLDLTSLVMHEGETATLTATVNPSDATEKTISWTSSNTTVVKVEGGIVTAVKEGTASISASCGDKSAVCVVTVKKQVISVTGIALDHSSITLTEGQQFTLTATIQPADATDKTVAWTSSNSGVATVDQNGRVTAVAEGSATITAQAGNYSATCTVTVKKDVVAVTSITLNITSLSLEVGRTATIVATVKPDNATDKTVTWTSSNSGVATVDQNGRVTAVAEGSATITATAGGKQATCTVTVIDSTMSGDNEGTGTEDWN